MSKPTLRLELDHGPWEGDEYNRCWPVGGVVTGRVRCYSMTEMKARGIRVELAWETSGRGDKDKEVAASQGLHNGNLLATRSYDFRFSLAVPEGGPITYEGHLMKVQWKVRAVIDRAFARDQEVAELFSVLPAYRD